MEVENDSIWGDPQCLQMIQVVLNMEIEAAENTLRSLEEATRKAKAKARALWLRRKELQEKIQTAKENIGVLTVTLNKQRKYNDELANKIQLVKLNLDDDFKVRQAESQKYEDILKQYKQTLQDYRAAYEEFPLANARREAQMRLKKIQVEKMVVEHKIEQLKKMTRQKEKIAWLRLRGRIVEFAKYMLNDMALDRKLMELNKTIQDRKEELKAVDEEIAVQLKVQEEKKRIRELEMLKMPPPKINMSYMKSHFRSSSRTSWRNFDDSLDSISVDTMMEEMCLSEETSLVPRRQSSFLEVDHGKEAIDTGSPCPVQNEEMEQEDAVPEAIDTPDEAPRRQEEPDPEEHPARDKQTSDLEDDIPPKRIRLMTDEPRAWSSPAATLKAAGQVPRKSQQPLDLPRGPRITKIETVRCNLSQKRGTDEPNRTTLIRSACPDRATESFSSNTTIRLKGVRLDQSPGSKTSRAEACEFSPMVRRDQVKPESMFSPAYSENSSMSFCVNNNFENLKDDQISFFDGSVRGFNPCSDISQDAPAASFKEQPDAGKAKDFSHVSFSNILKMSGNKGKKNLF